MPSILHVNASPRKADSPSLRFAQLSGQEQTPAQPLVVPFNRIGRRPPAARRQTREGPDVAGLAPLGQMRGVQPLPPQHLTASAGLGILVLLHDLQLVGRCERSALGPLGDLATRMVRHDTRMRATT